MLVQARAPRLRPFLVAQFSPDLKMVSVCCDFIALDAAAGSGPVPLDLICTTSRKATAKHMKRLLQQRDSLSEEVPRSSAALSAPSSPRFLVLVLRLAEQEVCKRCTRRARAASGVL